MSTPAAQDLGGYAEHVAEGQREREGFAEKPGRSASGAIIPAKMKTPRSHNVETAWTRVVQNAVVATTQPERKLSAAPRATLGTNRSRCAGVVRKRTSNVSATITRQMSSGMNVVSFQTTFSTIA